jgi:hypothetical protein
MGEPTHSRPANGSGERVRQINEALFSGSPAASALLARDSASWPASRPTRANFDGRRDVDPLPAKPVAAGIGRMRAQRSLRLGSGTGLANWTTALAWVA